METDCILRIYCVVIFLSKIEGAVYPSIQWNPHNPIFKTNYTLSVRLLSKMYLLCPNDATVMEALQHNTPKDELYENLWMVDKESFDSCAVNTSIKSNRLLTKCNEPLKLKYFSLVFQQYSGTDWGLEFTPGRDYFFIATSDGTKTSLDNLSEGHCKTRNMKIKIHVCTNGDSHCNSSHSTATTTSTPKLTTSRLLTSTPRITPGTSSPPTVVTKPEFEVQIRVITKLVNNRSTQLENKTAGNEPELGDRHPEVFAELAYQLVIGFLLAIVLLLMLVTTIMCFRLRKTSHICRFYSKKSSQTTVPDAPLNHRHSTASTRPILAGVRFSGISQTDGCDSYSEECESP